MKTLEQIDAERNDLIAKLAKIDEKRSTVSFEVYEKVKREYERKLKEIEKKLTSNVELVKAESGRLMNEKGDLQQQRKDIELLIEEADLRYSIGEYNDGDYNKVTGDNKSRLQELDKELAMIADRLKWVDSIGTGAAMEEVVKPAEPPELEMPKAPVEVKTEEPAEVQIEEPIIEMKEIIEELKAVDKEPVKKNVDNSGLEIDEHILETAIPEQVKKLDELLVEGEPEPVKEAAKPEPPKANESAKLKKGEKGVPCPKCGYVNTPDSWYCEKCGAEILESPLQ
ncbi:MAG TPA: zinc finger Ran-binding domain-containing protein [bacterium]